MSEHIEVGTVICHIWLDIVFLLPRSQAPPSFPLLAVRSRVGRAWERDLSSIFVYCNIKVVMSTFIQTYKKIIGIQELKLIRHFQVRY